MSECGRGSPFHTGLASGTSVDEPAAHHISHRSGANSLEITSCLVANLVALILNELDKGIKNRRLRGFGPRYDQICAVIIGL